MFKTEEKKVNFTTKNMILNWIFNRFGFIESPVNKGYHWINPYRRLYPEKEARLCYLIRMFVKTRIQIKEYR